MTTCWNRIPPIGDTSAYIREIGKIPLLTSEEEFEAGQSKSEEGRLKLILSHLRLGVSIARRYSTAIPFEDAIQEANLGLIEAATKFDPTAGARFSSFAMIYIQANIKHYLINNTRIVRIVTNKDQRKMFFNLSQAKTKILSGSGRNVLSPLEVTQIALEHNVSEKSVREMEERMAGSDAPIDDGTSDRFDENIQITPVADNRFSPLNVLEQTEIEYVREIAVPEAMEKLSDRERQIIHHRFIDDAPMTLKDLSIIFGVSLERIRQLEAKALKTLRQSLEEFA